MPVSQSQQIQVLWFALQYKNALSEPCTNVYLWTGPWAKWQSIRLDLQLDFHPKKKRKLKQDYVLQSGCTKDTSPSSMSKRCCFKYFDECRWWTGEVYGTAAPATGLLLQRDFVFLKKSASDAAAWLTPTKVRPKKGTVLHDPKTVKQQRRWHRASDKNINPVNKMWFKDD